MPSQEYEAYDIDTPRLIPPPLADFIGPDDEAHIFREAGTSSRLIMLGRR